MKAFLKTPRHTNPRHRTIPICLPPPWKLVANIINIIIPHFNTEFGTCILRILLTDGGKPQGSVSIPLHLCDLCALSSTPISGVPLRVFQLSGCSCLWDRIGPHRHCQNADMESIWPWLAEWREESGLVLWRLTHSATCQTDILHNYAATLTVVWYGIR